MLLLLFLRLGLILVVPRLRHPLLAGGSELVEQILVKGFMYFLEAFLVLEAQPLVEAGFAVLLDALLR